MILGRLMAMGDFSGAIPYAKEIADFLQKNDAATIPCGRYDVAGGVFVNVCDIENGKNNVYEAHRKYNDLQCVITGDEIMKRCHIEDCLDGTEYDDSADCILFKSADPSGESVLHLHEGDFAYFGPSDAHMPGIAGNTNRVRKLIFKIPV